MTGGRFKEWKTECPGCSQKGTVFGWTYDMPFYCKFCGTALSIDDGRASQTVMISTDDIPGGLEVRHGICNPDGSPKRYYSKTEIKRAANEKGVTILGDTPKPYKVSWSGKKSES